MHNLCVDNNVINVIVELYPDSFCIKDLCRGKIIFQGRSIHGLYMFSKKEVASDSRGLSFSLSAKALFTSISCKEVNWHAKLGHPNEVVLNKLVKASNVNCSICVPFHKCVVCPLGKTLHL